MHFWQNIITKTLSALKIVKITNCEKKFDFMKTDLFHFCKNVNVTLKSSYLERNENKTFETFFSIL